MNKRLNRRHAPPSIPITTHDIGKTISLSLSGTIEEEKSLPQTVETDERRMAKKKGEQMKKKQRKEADEDSRSAPKKKKQFICKIGLKVE